MEARKSRIRALLGGREPVDFVAVEEGAELVLQTEGHGERAVVGGLVKRPPDEGGWHLHHGTLLAQPRQPSAADPTTSGVLPDGEVPP